MFDAFLHAVALTDWFFVGMVLFGGVLLAHAVGLGMSRALHVAPGHAREVMPSLPVAPTFKGFEAIRFQKAVLSAERQLLRKFADGVEGAEATALADDLNQDPMVIGAALERLREEIPCQMRITSRGRILHDFAAEDIATLRNKRRAWLPVRLGVFALAGLANVGAIWPVLLIMTLAFWTLDIAVSTVDSNAAMWLGGSGLIAIVVCFAAAMAAGWVVHYLLYPFFASTPKIGSAAADKVPNRRSSGSDGSWWVFFDSGSSGSSSSSSSSSGGGGGGDSDGDGIAGLGQAIVIIIAIAIIVLCTIALYIWLRGLWRALSRDERELERISPAYWVRTAVPVDRFEKYLPTNDLVGRVYRALSRAHSNRRPVDEDLGPRVLLLASKSEGRVSTIDIAFAEGLDLNEAAEVGSRLCGLVDGHILVSDGGVLVFEFPPEVLRQIDANPDADLWAEFIEMDPKRRIIKRRKAQSSFSVPVNLVGLTYSHVLATDRLVGGTILMALSGMLLLTSPEMLDFQLFTGIESFIGLLASVSTPLTLALFAFAIGAMCLSAAARYTARAVAEHGIRRDIRRATYDLIGTAVRQGNRHIDLSGLPKRLTGVFDKSWPSITPELVEKEVEGVLIDLDLSPSLDAGGRLEVDLGELWEAWKDAKRTAKTLDGLDTPTPDDEEVVVFETAVTHDRVKVLA